ncbi:MAG: DUF2188 domain-containing protein [bacterium]
MPKNIHIVPSGNRWAVKQEGKTDPLSTHRTKDLADQKGRAEARKEEVELIIHGRNGQIQDKDSFGKDPCPPEDKKH